MFVCLFPTTNSMGHGVRWVSTSSASVSSAFGFQMKHMKAGWTGPRQAHSNGISSRTWHQPKQIIRAILHAYLHQNINSFLRNSTRFDVWPLHTLRCVMRMLFAIVSMRVRNSFPPPPSLPTLSSYFILSCVRSSYARFAFTYELCSLHLLRFWLMYEYDFCVDAVLGFPACPLHSTTFIYSCTNVCLGAFVIILTNSGALEICQQTNKMERTTASILHFYLFIWKWFDDQKRSHDDFLARRLAKGNLGVDCFKYKSGEYLMICCMYYSCNFNFSCL